MQRYYAWLLVVTAMVITNVAYGFYDPNLQRWINRDPLGEPGFEVRRRERTDNLADGQNLYLFVQNSMVLPKSWTGGLEGD